MRNTLLRMCPGLAAGLLWLPVVAAELTVVIVDKNTITPAGTVVELSGGGLSPAPVSQAIINQQDGEFTPLLTIVPQGSSVEFINNDDYSHHVYSVSGSNQFELPLYKGKPPKNIVFSHPGVVKLGCNIHDWMLAYAYISQSQALVLTDESGIAVFTGLEAGDYRIRVWNPRLRNNKKVLTAAVSIRADAAVEKIVTVSLRPSLRRAKKRNQYSDEY